MTKRMPQLAEVGRFAGATMPMPSTQMSNTRTAKGGRSGKSRYAAHRSTLRSCWRRSGRLVVGSSIRRRPGRSMTPPSGGATEKRRGPVDGPVSEQDRWLIGPSRQGRKDSEARKHHMPNPPQECQRWNAKQVANSGRQSGRIRMGDRSRRGLCCLCRPKEQAERQQQVAKDPVVFRSAGIMPEKSHLADPHHDLQRDGCLQIARVSPPSVLQRTAPPRVVGCAHSVIDGQDANCGAIHSSVRLPGRGHQEPLGRRRHDGRPSVVEVPFANLPRSSALRPEPTLASGQLSGRCPAGCCRCNTKATEGPLPLLANECSGP